MALKPPLFDFRVADDQLSIDTKFTEIIRKHDIQAANVKKTIIVPFGGIKFLVMLAFLGAYVNDIFVGLRNIQVRRLVLKRTLKSTNGLLSTLVRSLKIKRTQTVLAGIKSLKKKSIGKPEKLSAGLKSSITEVYTDL
jgi:hypothetical protein